MDLVEIEKNSGRKSTSAVSLSVGCAPPSCLHLFRPKREMSYNIDSSHKRPSMMGTPYNSFSHHRRASTNASREYYSGHRSGKLC